MKKNKLLFITDFYPPYSKGGAEISTQKIAESLCHDYDVGILTQQFVQKPWHSNNIKVDPLLANTDNRFILSKNKFKRLFTLICFPIINFWTTYSYILAHKIDTINIVPTTYFLLPCIIASILTRRKVIIDARSYSLITFDDELFERRWLSIFKSHYIFDWFYFSVQITILKFLLKLISSYHIIAISEFVKGKLVLNGYNEDKIEVIYNFVDDVEVKPLKRENQIVFAGRLTQDKGVWKAVKGFIAASKPDWELMIIGDGPEKDNIKNFIKLNRIRNIFLLGKKSQKEVVRQYSKSKIILAPSEWQEPFGRFILEAIQTKTPVISTRTGGITELMNLTGIGILVNKEDIDGISNAINRMISSTNEYKEYIKNTKVAPRLFNKLTLLSKRIELYEEI